MPAVIHGIDGTLCVVQYGAEMVLKYAFKECVLSNPATSEEIAGICTHFQFVLA